MKAPLTISLSELYHQYKGLSAIPYEEYLRTEDWKKRRDYIVNRDGKKCQKCQLPETTMWSGVTPFGVYYSTTEEGLKHFIKPCRLEVHHKLYYLNRLPWDYDDSQLTTLCSECHEEEHETNQILVYFDDKTLVTNKHPCQRCGGRGVIPPYKHVQNGLCFKCRGTKINIQLIDRWM